MPQQLLGLHFFFVFHNNTHFKPLVKYKPAELYLFQKVFLFSLPFFIWLRKGSVLITKGMEGFPDVTVI